MGAHWVAYLLHTFQSMRPYFSFSGTVKKPDTNEIVSFSKKRADSSILLRDAFELFAMYFEPEGIVSLRMINCACIL